MIHANHLANRIAMVSDMLALVPPADTAKLNACMANQFAALSDAKRLVWSMRAGHGKPSPATWAYFVEAIRARELASVDDVREEQDRRTA